MANMGYQFEIYSASIPIFREIYKVGRLKIRLTRFVLVCLFDGVDSILIEFQFRFLQLDKSF